MSLHRLLIAMGLATWVPAFAQTQPAVLVFSKTAGFRHDSIETGVDAIKSLGKQHGFRVDSSENASLLNQDTLRRYAAVVFLSTTGDILNRSEERAFEQYIRSGHGFVGIHSAADTEYDWPWYGELVGGYFDSHDAIQNATVLIEKPFGTAALPRPWVRRDEWYNYKQRVRDATVILKLDTTTFKGSKHDGDHPIAWYREFDGGRSFYTGFGHTKESYAEPAFLAHVLDGIKYAIGPTR